MVLLDISIQSRVVIGISAMLLLFVSFLIVFVSNQRKKIQYHKELQAMNEEPINSEKLRWQLEIAESRLRDLLNTHTPTHPLVLKTRQSVEELRQKVEQN